MTIKCSIRQLLQYSEELYSGGCINRKINCLNDIWPLDLEDMVQNYQLIKQTLP